MINWLSIKKYFSIEDFSDPLVNNSGNLIDENLLSMLIDLSMLSGTKIIPHGKVGGCVDVNGKHGHATNSYHLMSNGCKAVDFHFNTDILNIREQFNFICIIGFTGIGVYYDWKWDNKQLKVGFHVDIRPKRFVQIWKKEKERYIYFLK